jgi:starch-binding outer membrane protein, SusD/RagB family
MIDLNIVRSRARGPLPGDLPDLLPFLDQASAIAGILHERQLELFTEWGHRWFDLKRTGEIDNVMNIVSAEKGGSWSTNWQLYPIPNVDIESNPNISQNPGY